MGQSIIELIEQHSSVRNFTDEKIPDKDIEQILRAGQAAASWKNFQSYSIINVASQSQKDAIYAYQPQKAIKNASNYLVFVGDLKRAETAVKLYQEDFEPAGVESLLISSVDAALAAENCLLAAESLGYGGVIVGLIRDQSAEISEVLGLPDYTYPIFGVALGVPARKNPVKPRLPLDVVVMSERYKEATEKDLRDYDLLQKTYEGAHRLDSEWTERMVAQWGKPEIPSSTDNLKAKKLLK
ncbi:MAG: nitroreductase family protein [Streptococcaceae bacterium]|jgi:nitroreductase|nr:nitroreductase family protein [Streptococcaceae bacterium]